MHRSTDLERKKRRRHADGEAMSISSSDPLLPFVDVATRRVSIYDESKSTLLISTPVASALEAQSIYEQLSLCESRNLDMPKIK